MCTEARLHNPRLQQHNRFQQRYYATRVRAVMRPSRSAYVQRQVEELVRFGKLTPPQRILDVGCGMGRHAFLLAELGFTVEGLELSDQLIEALRRADQGAHRVRVYQGDVHNPPAALESRYDAVVGFFVLHHLADLKLAFRGIARMLRPGGTAVFLEPNAFNPLFYLQILVTPGMRWRAEKGLLNMRAAPVFGAMSQAGFRELRSARYGFFPPFVHRYRWMRRIEQAIEKGAFCEPWLAFQLFCGTLGFKR